MDNGRITWTTEKRRISELIPAEYNPRELTEKQAEDLHASLHRFNLADPIVINKDNKIIGGHQRINILKRSGDIEVDVRVPSRQLEDHEERELNLRLNKNLGQWDWDQLANFDEDFLKEVGFTTDELLENFGLLDAESIDVDQERLDVITVEAPEAPQIFSRKSFYFEDKEEFDRVCAFFKGMKDNKLDVQKLMDLTR